MLENFLKEWGFADSKAVFSIYDENGKQYLPVSENLTIGRNMWQIDLQYKCGATESIYISREGNGIVCRRDFANGDKEISISELGLSISGVTFGGESAQDYFYHNENPRVYQVATIPVDFDRLNQIAIDDSGFDVQAGNRWIDPGVINERIGRCPYQPFPAILLSNYGVNSGLLHGTLSQDVFYHAYTVSHAADGTMDFNIFAACKTIKARVVAPNEHLRDMWYMGVTGNAADYDHIFDDYTAVLRNYLVQPYGATAINRDNVVWGTWNDGVFRDVNEEMVIREAEYLAANFPTCRWIQLDDGYAVYDKHAHGLGMPYEKEAGVDFKKFPGNLRGLTDKIRATGLRPALWIGGFVPVECKLYKEHPDWFMDYSYRLDHSAPLDPSIPEVREYMTSALDTLIVEGNFDGVKHDFWSYAFEDSHDLLKNKNRTGYEHRSWWLAEMRKRLATDGYFQTGCDIVMGNPFLGKYFSNYRYGIDIGNGHWDNVKTNFRWGIACFATHTGDLFVPNSDSIGLFPGLNDVDAEFCVNYCVTTHSMVEIAGLLSKNSDHPRFKMLKKAVCNPNNGQDVYTANYDYRKDDIPQMLYFKTGHFTPAENVPGLPVRTVGFFNIFDESTEVEFSAADFGLAGRKYLLTDVWNNQTLRLSGKNSLALIAHGSRLFAISPDKPRQILDGNLKITANGRKLALAYPGEGEFFLSSPVSGVKVNGSDVPCKCVDGNGNWKLTFTAGEAGEIEFIWA